GLSTWTALTSDGVKHYFGPGTTTGDGRTRWLISREVDAHGNTVRYFWTRTAIGSYFAYSLSRIEYTSNPGAGLGAHAKVELGYAPLDLCAGSSIPVGAAPAHENPLVLEGARRLTSIATFVADAPGAPWRPARQIDLDYQLRSSSLHYPI